MIVERPRDHPEATWSTGGLPDTAPSQGRTFMCSTRAEPLLHTG